MIGQTISHYKILEKLGEGGMGVVYKAHDTKLDRYVALKFLPLNLSVSQEDVKRFEMEAKAISALNHPNIATIYDFDEASGQKYLALEYIPGGTLKSKLRQLKSEDKEFSISEVVDYGIQMAEALAHAHRHQIIHRDVKTDNMMLTEDGKVKLTDFGLAKLRGGIQITKTGSTLGTAAYMSPEQIRGEDVDRRSDIFSLGVVLYELVTSHLPFQGDFEAALSYSILNENPPPVKSLRLNVPQSLEQIITRCLEKDKANRYQDVDKIVADLKKVQQEISGSAEVAKSSKVRWIVAAALLVLAVIGIYLFYPKSGPTSAISKSVAVLPFKNLSDSKEDEYFSDGITDDIIAQLSKITELKVISRTSVMQYKATNKNVRDIGKELDVGAVLEGSVRRSGNQIRIVAQLIDANNEGHLWAETYDKEMTQVFAIQSDVAQRIASALRAKLSPGEKERIEKKRTENTEAYQLYLKGRFYWNKRTGDDLKTALGYFNQAIEKDPNYALAYAGLASAYALFSEYTGLPSNEAMPKAEAAAKKALGLDTALAEAHAVLAIIKQWEWNWTDSEIEFKRAIELDPNDPSTRNLYYNRLSCMGRFDEANTEIKRAQELDPLSLIINVNVGELLYKTRQFDKAIDQLKKTLELDSNFAAVHIMLGATYEMQNRLDEAIAEYKKARSLFGSGTAGLSDLGRAYARAGRENDALKILDSLFRFSKQGYSVAFDIAIVYYGLEEKSKTFEWFEKAYQERAVGLIYLKTEPTCDDLHPDPRFIALMRKIGIEK
jgi:serine/threonine-protein kinase